MSIYLKQLQEGFSEPEEIFEFAISVSEYHRENGFTRWDANYWVQMRNALILQLVNWSSEKEERVNVMLYKLIALSSFMIAKLDGALNASNPHALPMFDEKKISEYSSTDILVCVSLLEQDWVSMDYDTKIFKRLETIDVLVGSIVYSEDSEHQVDTEDYILEGEDAFDADKFLKDVSISMTQMHVYYAVVSSLFPEHFEFSPRDTELEEWIIEYIKVSDYRGCVFTFREIFWSLAVEPGEVEKAIKKNKGKPKIITAKSAMKKMGRNVLERDVMMNKAPWDIHAQLVAQGERQFSGALLILMFDYIARSKLRLPNWHLETVELFADVGTFQRSENSTLIVKCFGGYHVLSFQRMHVCGDAASAIRQWLSIKYPNKSLEEVFF